jgi:hypothetical protein
VLFEAVPQSFLQQSASFLGAIAPEFGAESQTKLALPPEPSELLLEPKK